MKASEFNVLTDSFFDGVDLLFNTRSGALLEVPRSARSITTQLVEPGRTFDPTETSLMADLLGVDLVASGVLIGGSFDERAWIKQDYFASREAAKYSRQHLSLTVSPTVACNFRCGYCFERHPNRRFSDQDVSNLAHFVDGRLDPGGSVSVLWFGGEPLAAFDQLQSLHTALLAVVQSKGGSFSHSMISNGSLLFGPRLEWLIKTGMSSIKVKVDGPARIHDPRRPTAGGGGTYDKIMKNVEGAAPHISICLRVNIDRTNVEYLPELLDDLQSRGLHRLVSIDLGHIREYTETAASEQTRMSLTKPEMAAAKVLLVNEMLERGFSSALPTLPEPRRGSLCVADNPNGFVVSPGGLTFGCWNEAANDESEASMILRAVEGKVSMAPNNAALHDEWLGYDPFSHRECETCKVAPLCRGGCPWIWRRNPDLGAGDCTYQRWNLPDWLRWGHLNRTLANEERRDVG